MNAKNNQHYKDILFKLQGITGKDIKDAYDCIRKTLLNVGEKEKVMTIYELRKMGYKVRVTHKRVAQIAEPKFKAALIKGKPYGGSYCLCEIDPRGGSTKVEVRTPDGTELIGESRCNYSDNYNKKEGLRIALGRALREKEKEES